MADPSTDFALLERWREGEEGAGRELFGRYFDAVYRFFRSKLAHAAEDLTQQTFMSLVQSRDSFRGEASFRTFVFTVARKRLYDHLRTLHRKPTPEGIGSVSIADIASFSPSRAVAEREEQQLLLKALRTLPLDMQVALELHYWEELTVTEIAGVLEVAEGTVKSRLQRARARLDERLAALAGSDELLRSTLDDFQRWARDLQTYLAARRTPDAAEAPDASDDAPPEGGDAPPA